MKKQFAKIPLETVNHTLKYLQTRPWIETNQLLKLYDGVEILEEEIEEPKPLKGKDKK